VAGLPGPVLGETTPSVTGVAVIGVPEAGYAVNVYFKHTGQSLWFAPHLLEFIDHAPGTKVRLEGSPREWVRQVDGEWVETPWVDQSLLPAHDVETPVTRLLARLAKWLPRLG
jgi:hypothetical protein